MEDKAKEHLILVPKSLRVDKKNGFFLHKWWHINLCNTFWKYLGNINQILDKNWFISFDPIILSLGIYDKKKHF